MPMLPQGESALSHLRAAAPAGFESMHRRAGRTAAVDPAHIPPTARSDIERPPAPEIRQGDCVGALAASLKPRVGSEVH